MDQFIIKNPFTQNVKGFVGFLLSGDGRWDTITENAVFGKNFSSPKFDLATKLSNYPLKNKRNQWAEDKDLIIASSLLTQAPALTGNQLTASQQQDSLRLVQSLMGTQTGLNYTPVTNSLTNPTPPRVPGAAPIMLTDIRRTGHKQPDLFPGGDITLQYGHWDISAGYFVPSQSSKATTVLTNEALTDKVKDLYVVHTAANSSAAGGGFVDIPMFKKTKTEYPLEGLAFNAFTARMLNGFAPPYELQNGFSYVEKPKNIRGLSEEELAEKKVVRLADGGFVDNTSVAYMLRYMQDNNYLSDGFNILAMNNFPGKRFVNEATNKPFPTTKDVALLFDNDDPNQDTTAIVGIGPFQYESGSPAVFERIDYFSKDKADWSVESKDPKCEYFVGYTKYEVTTRTNHFFGITQANVNGNLHVFSIISKKAGVVPTDNDEMACYKTLLDVVHQEVVNGKLGQYFEEALFPNGI